MKELLVVCGIAALILIVAMLISVAADAQEPHDASCQPVCTVDTQGQTTCTVVCR